MDTVGQILAELLLKRQMQSGGWSFFGSRQSCVEATSLAVLALGLDAEDARRSGIPAGRPAHGRQLAGVFRRFGRELGDGTGTVHAQHNWRPRFSSRKSTSLARCRARPRGLLVLAVEIQNS